MTETQQVLCQIRREWVKATPEEIVRQTILQEMISNLGYPLGHVVVEKGLRQMPHLSLFNQKLPDRRADIVCFAQGIHPTCSLYPLLLVECKAVKITSKTFNQAAGYNHYLGAFFLALANGEEIQTAWFDSTTQSYKSIKRLPAHAELMQNLKTITVH